MIRCKIVQHRHSWPRIKVRGRWQGEAAAAAATAAPAAAECTIVRLAGGGEEGKQAVTAEFTLLRMAGVPKAHADLC